MIQLNEVRRGNKIRQAHATLTVRAIGSRRIWCDDGNGHTSWCTPEKLDGIELSNELLNMYGFNLAPQRQSIYINGRLSLWMGHTGCIAYLMEKGEERQAWIGDCKYLHHLQNLWYAIHQTEL
jgi:hypothetical protein